jgi:hypothetical protein
VTASPDFLLASLRRTTDALEQAETRDPFGDDVDQLVDEAAAARIAIRRSQLDAAWSVAEREIDDLAAFLSPARLFREVPSGSSGSSVRLATGLLMERYGIDKNGANTLLSESAARHCVPTSRLAARLLADARVAVR